MKWVGTLKRFIGGHQQKEPSITVHEDGFSFLGNNGLPAQVQWGEVLEIRACKLDLSTWDEVRFRFVLSSGKEVELSEDQPGFDAALSAVCVSLPCVAGWRNQIIKPAFARNETVFFL